MTAAAEGRTGRNCWTWSTWTTCLPWRSSLSRQLSWFTRRATTGANVGGCVADSLKDVASLLLSRLWHQRRIISVRSAHPEVPRWLDGHR